MKISFVKAKHYWEDGNTATWERSDTFEKDILSVIKTKYSQLSKSKIDYMDIDGKTIFLFYRETKDIFERPIVEIAALYSKYKFKNNAKIHQILKSQIAEIFDSKTSYEVIIEKDMIRYSRIWITYASIFAIVALSLYIFRPTEDTKQQKIKTNVSIKVDSSHRQPKENIPQKNTIHEENIVPKSPKTDWRWKNFCDQNQINHQPKHCYEAYIKEKCHLQNQFAYSYNDFIRDVNRSGTICINIRIIGGNYFEKDEQIPTEIKTRYKDFFTEGD